MATEPRVVPAPDPRVRDLTLAAGSTDWQTRRSAVTRAGALLQTDPASTVVDAVAQLLERAAGDPKFEVRCEVARALTWLHHAKFLPLTAQLTRDPHPLVAELAEATLARRTQADALERDHHARVGQVAIALDKLAAEYSPDELARFHDAIGGAYQQASAAVVHDVGHLVGAVYARVEELCDPDQSAEQRAAAREEIRRRLVRIHEIVKFQAVLTAPAPTALDRVVVREAVVDAVKTACDLLGRPEAAVAVHVGRHHVLRAPRTSLVRALTNTVVNALQAAGDEGAVRVNAERTSGEQISIAVSNGGRTMPATARQVLLTGVPTGHTTFGQHGWGLVIVNRLMAGHCRAEIEVEDARGGGTTVLFRLPVGAPEEE